MRSDFRLYCSRSTLHQLPIFTCIPAPDGPPHQSDAVLTGVDAATPTGKALETAVHVQGQLHGLHAEPIPDLHQSQALLTFFSLHMASPSPIKSSCTLAAISLTALKMEPPLAP